MNNEARHLSQIGVPGNAPSALIGFIYLPLDVDRERFIKHCLDTHTVCLITEKGQVFKDVNISNSNLQEIEFPADKSVVGSIVVCVNIPIHNKPVVVSVLKLDDQNSILHNEHSFRLLKVLGGNLVDLQGDAEKGTLNITVNSSDTNNESTISFLNKNNKAKVKVFVQGNLTVDCEETLNIENTKEVNIKDDNGNVVSLNKNGLNYTKDKKSEKIALGESLVDWLGDFCAEIQKITVISAAPGSPTSPPSNIAQIGVLQQRLQSILSDNTKLA